MFTIKIFQPGGGQVKIAVRKLEWKAVSKTDASNEKYQDKKVQYTFNIETIKHEYFLLSCSQYRTSLSAVLSLILFSVISIKWNFYFRVMSQKILKRGNQVTKKKQFKIILMSQT